MECRGSCHILLSSTCYFCTTIQIGRGRTREEGRGPEVVLVKVRHEDVESKERADNKQRGSVVTRKEQRKEDQRDPSKDVTKNRADPPLERL